MFGKRGPSDEQIVSQIRKGDQQMLVLLYKRNLAPVRTYITQNKGEQEDVEDMLQEALVVLWQNVQKAEFSLSSKLDTYLYAIAKNLWLKQLRKNSRTDSQDFSDDRAPELADDSPPDEGDDKTALLARYMEKLGPVCRDLLSLFYFEEWDMEQIAQKLRFANADTAKAKKYQCKKKLEDLIRKHYKAEDLL